VHCIDPTPRAVAHVEALREHARAGTPMPINGREDRAYPDLTEAVTDKLTFHPVGLFDQDDTLRFYAPKNRAHVSHSAVNLQGTADYFEARCRSPRSLMRELGHARIDLLKLDIEGAEHAVLDHLLRERILPRILCIEFDYAARGRRRRAAVARLWQLSRAGYELAFHRDWNVTLVHTAVRRSRRRDLLWGAGWLLGILPRVALLRLGNHRPAAG
jgi:FkbM family methyltransferase